MVLALVLVFGAVVICGAAVSGEIGTAAVFVVIVLLVLGMCRTERRDSEAYVRRREYWRRQR